MRSCCYKAVGLIWIIALLTIPTYLAETFATKLSSMMIISSNFRLTMFTISGLVVSYFYDISSETNYNNGRSCCLGVVKLIKYKNKKERTEKTNEKIDEKLNRVL